MPGGDENEIVYAFLEAIFKAFHTIYTCKLDLKDGEAVFNDLLIYSFFKAAANAVGEETNSGAQFRMGEVSLTAMKKQMKDYGDANPYLADSIVKMYGLYEPEVLLETSSHFGSESPYGSIEIFSKVLFAHATGTKVLLWCLKYIKEGPAYELWLEEAFDTDTKFGKAVEQLPQALNFYWKMKCLLKQTVDAVNELESGHKKVLKQCRFTSLPVENLFFLVNSSIMRLTDAEDKAGLSEVGPFNTQ
ncbi:hypothetical protein G6F43_006868 [Rhizopus delemar]|nr:hypothetical protein G6F43_006868 [Rhizopus delemar]